jgi:hypothetical protein
MDVRTPNQERGPNGRQSVKRASKFLTAMGLASSLLLPATKSPAQVNDNVPVRCQGSPSDQWFNTWGNGHLGWVQCTRQLNHIVLDVCNDDGACTFGAVDMWYGASCDAPRFFQPEEGYPFKMASHDLESTVGCGLYNHRITRVANLAMSARGYYEPVRLHQCAVLPDYSCNYLNGFIDLNPNETLTFGVFGRGDSTIPSTYTTTIAIYLQ